MKTNRLIILLSIITMAACGQKKAEQFKALPFPDMDLPGMMTEAQDITDYMVEHYWDRFTNPDTTYPSDTLLVNGVKKGDVEQKFSNWLVLLDRTTLTQAEKAITKLYNRALAIEKKDSTSNVLETVVELADKYLYDANSPFRNEEYYLYFVRHFAEYNGHSPEIRAKYNYHVSNCSLNRLRTKAAEFQFTDSYGKRHSLYDINAELTLLFFSNPGCGACMDIIQALKDEEKISEMISSRRLAVANIYIDEDLAGWKDYMPIYPKEWYNGFDHEMKIRTDNLYNVRAIPSLYILDRDKRIIMKDAPETKAIEFLLMY